MLAKFCDFDGGNELLEISDNQHDDEMSLFIEENWNVLTTKKDEN